MSSASIGHHEPSHVVCVCYVYFVVHVILKPNCCRFGSVVEHWKARIVRDDYGFVHAQYRRRRRRAWKWSRRQRRWRSGWWWRSRRWRRRRYRQKNGSFWHSKAWARTTAVPLFFAVLDLGLSVLHVRVVVHIVVIEIHPCIVRVFVVRVVCNSTVICVQNACPRYAGVTTPSAAVVEVLARCLPTTANN